MNQAANAGFSVQPYLQNRFETAPKVLRFTGKTQEEAAEWQRRARHRLGLLIGLDTMLPCDARPEITERVEEKDHWRERVVLQVEPGVAMPVYVLIPKAGKPPYPVVIAPHGHGGGGKVAVAGIRKSPEVAEAIEHYQYDYGPAFCRAGFITFCPDARGFGERQETLAKEQPLSASCQWINHMALPLGQTVTGMWVWDLQRLIDYVEARDDCDAARLGCAGLSGGGLQTLWTTALDVRIKAAVDSGYFYGCKESLLDKHGNCSCNYVPHLWEHADMGDIGGLVAPRPFMVQSGTEDGLNGASGLANVTQQLDLARNAYAAYNAADRLVHDVFEGPHRWDATNTIPFMQHALGV